LLVGLSEKRHLIIPEVANRVVTVFHACVVTVVENALDDSSFYPESFWPSHEFNVTLDHIQIHARQTEPGRLIGNVLSNKIAPGFADYVNGNSKKLIDSQALGVVR